MLSQETVSKISTIVLRPGVYGVNIQSEANQIWVNVHGALESVNVAAEIQFLFPELKLHDDTAWIVEHTEDRVASYSFSNDELIIDLTGWLPKEKDSAQDGANSEKPLTHSNTESWTPEEILRREA